MAVRIENDIGDYHLFKMGLCLQEFIKSVYSNHDNCDDASPKCGIIKLTGDEWARYLTIAKMKGSKDHYQQNNSCYNATNGHHENRCSHDEKKSCP